MSDEQLIRTNDICKSFGATKALVNVNIEVKRGEIRGLIGENGSGKSTVSSIIAGVQEYDSGEMFFKGKPYKPRSMVEAQEMGISMVVQEMGTIPNIGIADNIFIGKENRFTKYGFVNRKKMYREAERILGEIGAEFINPRESINSLNMENRKIVEIARAVYDLPEVFIVDETTTALSHIGRTIIYNLMNRLRDEGKAVVFISHDLDELMSTCNAITVLRDGHLIDTLTKDGMEIDRMRNLMVGRELNGDYYRADFDGTYSNEVVLKAEQITSGPVLENFFLELHRGEILGIGGLSDCGMHDIGRALFGIDKLVTGKVVLTEGNVEIDSPKTAIDNKIGYVSKNRDQEAVILNASIGDNLVLPSLDILKNKFQLIFPQKEKQLADKQIDFMRIKCRNRKQFVRDLSGGNKQKVVFAKWLGNGAEILILDCPTRGIDVGVKAAMYQFMTEYKKEGKSIILISEEMPELIGMSDRILILKDGQQTAEFARSEDLTEMQIISKMI